MLEGLEAIDWSRLGTAYGNAEQLPEALRNIRSNDQDLRGQALGTLHTELTHQGTIYEASVYVVPFLLELLAEPSSPDKSALVKLLAYLASKGAYLGEMYECLDNRLLYQEITLQRRRTISRSSEEISEYRRTIEQVRRAVREGLPLFLAFLKSVDPLMRMEVAYAFTFFPEDAPILVPAVIDQCKKEEDECVLSCLLFCLGYLRLSTPEVDDLLRQYVRQQESVLLRFIAAMALCVLFEEQTPEEAVRELFAVLVDPYLLQPAYERLPSEWGSCWVHMRALLYLDKLVNSSHQKRILEGLLDAFPGMEERIVRDCADLLLRVAFYDKGFPYNRQRGNADYTIYRFQELDPLQQRILHLFEEKDVLWEEPLWRRMSPWRHSGPVYFELLAHLGLPACRADLQAFLVSSH